ncbi:MAG: hypothetical protein CBC12_00795 [Candidatus Puniceispirillum sp. TMED52]|nr:MAG: hypothetical protein CBC12_00795 [Candidatus Puniceispirillum sp. TMED52]
MAVHMADISKLRALLNQILKNSTKSRLRSVGYSFDTHLAGTINGQNCIIGGPYNLWKCLEELGIFDKRHIS